MCSASSCRRGCVSLWPLAVSMGSMHEHMRPTLSLLTLFLLRARAPCAANYAHCYDSECCASDPDVAPALAVPRLSCPFSLLSADVRCPVWLVSLCARPVRLLQGSKGKGQKMKAQKGGAVDDDRDELTKTMDMDL